MKSNELMRINYSKLTPCGGCCEDCGHYKNNECKGCIATKGRCIHMWQGSNGGVLLNDSCEIAGIVLGGSKDIFGNFRYGMAMPCDKVSEFIEKMNNTSSF